MRFNRGGHDTIPRDSGHKKDKKLEGTVPRVRHRECELVHNHQKLSRRGHSAVCAWRFRISESCESGLATQKTRLGQDEFREMMIKRWIHKCCGVVPLLHAAHIDPWSKNKKARLSFENGLLLLSTVHKLFDEGLISFRD